MQTVIDVSRGEVVIGEPLGSASGTEMEDNVILWRGGGLGSRNRYSVEVRYPGFKVTICDDLLVANLRTLPTERWCSHVLSVALTYLSTEQVSDLLKRDGEQLYRCGWREGVRSLQSQLRELLTEDIEVQKL